MSITIKFKCDLCGYEEILPVKENKNIPLIAHLNNWHYIFDDDGSGKYSIICEKCFEASGGIHI